MMDDEAFASTFHTWEQALSSAGEMVAHQWLQVRQNASDENATASGAEATSRLAMNKRIRERAATLRQAAEGSPALVAMPDVLCHRQLSSFRLKDGTLLCGAYQLGQCSQWESNCGAAHRCAVLLRSGRVCGGQHAAEACRDKRYRPVEDGSATAEAPAKPSTTLTPKARPSTRAVGAELSQSHPQVIGLDLSTTPRIQTPSDRVIHASSGQAWVCMGDWQVASAPSSSSSSRPHHWMANHAIEHVELEKATEWRRTHEVMDDEAFASTFHTWEQALSSAGEMVAHQWLQVRQNASDENATASDAEATSRLAMNKRIRERAATLLQAAEGSPALVAMPDVLCHRQLSSFLKDGTLLCGAYQLGQCSQWEINCGAAHRCAVLLRSGRVCGGQHAAEACRDKRYRPVEDGSAATAEAPAKPSTALTPKARLSTSAVGAEMSQSHPVIGLDRGNPGLLGHTKGSLGMDTPQQTNECSFHFQKRTGPFAQFIKGYDVSLGGVVPLRIGLFYFQMAFAHGL